MNLTNIFRFRKPEGTDPVNVEDFNDNFDVIDEELNKRPEKTGNASDMVTAFVQAASRSNLTPGEKISMSFGKIMKYFADMKTVAFTGSYADLSNKPSIPGGAAASQAVANNCTTTAAGSVLDARQGKVLMDKANQINSDLGGCKISWDGSNFWAQNGSSKKKLGKATAAKELTSEKTTGSNGETISVTYTCPSDKLLLVCGASRCDGNANPNNFNFAGAIPVINNVLIINDNENSLRLFVGLIDAAKGAIVSCSYTITGRYTAAYLCISELT
mgnify:CR=1 FL=1